MAQKIYKSEWTSDQIRAKKLMYILRPLIACEWIFEGKGMPPTRFLDMLHEPTVDSELQDEINKLIRLKANLDEADTLVVPDCIRSWVETKIRCLDANAEKLTRPERQDLKALNEVLLSNVQEPNR